jgi:type I restriction enzyme S subunit
MSGWQEYILDNVIDKFIDYRGKTPIKTDFGIPLITAKIVKDGKILPPNEFIAADDYDLWMTRGLPEVNDVVLTTEAPLGEVALIKDRNVALAQRIITLRGKKSIVFNPFLKYYFQSDVGQYELQSRASGTTVFGIKAAILKEVPIILPPLPEQKAIAAVLGSLDDKIDLLHRQNKTLEAMAETLFRQWFVEEARDDWVLTKVKHVCIQITKGTTPTTLGKSFRDAGINFIKAESLTDYGGFLHEKFAFIDEETNELLKRSVIQKDDVLITIAGTIGRIALVPETILPANTNQAIGIIRVDKKLVSPYFIYCLLKSDDVRNDFEGRIVHAVQPNLSLGEISDIEFRMPPKENLEKGTSMLRDVFLKKEFNQIQITTLEQLRDTLLPKLMSGEVRVAV